MTFIPQFSDIGNTGYMYSFCSRLHLQIHVASYLITLNLKILLILGL